MRNLRLKLCIGSPLCLALLLAVAPRIACAQEQPKAKVLVTNLENPSGLAIHDGTGDIFIASECGVYRFKPTEKDPEKKIHLEIINSLWDTTSDVYGKGPMYTIGPLGLAFMDQEHLVVGDGSRKGCEEVVRVYKIDSE